MSNVTYIKKSPFDEKTMQGMGLYKRVHGMGSLTLAAGEVGDFEFQVPYVWAKLEAIEIMDSIDSVQAELFIEDDDLGTYSTIPRYILNQFGFDVEIPKGYYCKRSSFDSDLFDSMWIVLQITNTSSQEQTLRANVELNELK